MPESKIDGVDLDGYPISGDVPASPVPGQLIHNGIEPTTPADLEKLNQDLNNGRHIETARRLGGIMNILHRDGSGWVILVGTTTSLGAAIGLFELTKKLLEHREKGKK